MTAPRNGPIVGERMSGAPILTLPRNTWRRVHAEQAGIIVDAADYFRAFHAAAERAQHHILISGWQFDRGVQLLRGTDAVGREADVELLHFLDRLCTRTPSLRIYLLAWDFHMVFAFEREWMQRFWFHYATNERMSFRFEETESVQGCHHQKFAVIDGHTAFVGGIDLCEARWDDRAHRTVNPLRMSRGEPVKPYHDVQAYLVGPEPAAALRDLFVERWARSGAEPPELGPAAPPGSEPAAPPPPGPGFGSGSGAIALGPGAIALSRTEPRRKDETIREIEHLLIDALGSAEQLIYIETQYFSSTRLREALIERMRAPHRPHLEIVVFVNPRAEKLKEEIAVGLRQAKNLEALRGVAAETGNALGIYYSLSDGAGAGQRATYLHSKLLAVDDRLLTVGSANLTNRSMEIDTELNVAWEAHGGAGDEAAVATAHARARRIRRLRVSLLAEHGGFVGLTAVRALVQPRGLVARLDALADQPAARLQRHGPPTVLQETVMMLVDPEELPFDPDRAEYADGEAADDEEDLPQGQRAAAERAG